MLSLFTYVSFWAIMEPGNSSCNQKMVFKFISLLNGGKNMWQRNYWQDEEATQSPERVREGFVEHCAVKIRVLLCWRTGPICKSALEITANVYWYCLGCRMNETVFFCRLSLCVQTGSKNQATVVLEAWQCTQSAAATAAQNLYNGLTKM